MTQASVFSELDMFSLLFLQHWCDQLLKNTANPKQFIDVKVLDDLSHLTLDVIGQSAFGYNFNTILGGDSKISIAFATSLSAMDFKYLICKFLIPFFDYLPLPVNKKFQKAREISDNTVLEVSTCCIIFMFRDLSYQLKFVM